jgi:hypothetical protein
MTKARIFRTVAIVAVATAIALPAPAQQTIGVSSSYMGYSFDSGLGADAAQLLLVPVAMRFKAGSSLTLDIYSAWAQGKVEREGTEFSLQGVVDTRVKLSLAFGPWAMLSVGVAVPTGNASHNSEEAVVASVLSTDLLGFREATWGTGFSVTPALATAVRAGGFGIGLAAAYAARSEFEPSADLDLTYQPGNESRLRLGIDRNFGNTTLTMGVTVMKYEQDLADGRNLFQAGNRMRADVTYAFRAGAGVWTIYAADLWRENGDLTLSIVDELNTIVGDTTVATAMQNLLVGGIMGSIGVGGSYVFRPHIDFKYQIREEADGRDEGSGWILGAGGDFPLRLFGGADFFPKARILLGSIKNPAGSARSLMGAEFSGTLRLGF